MTNTAQKNSKLPLEIERKYLIAYPNMVVLTEQPHYNATEITQAYLLSSPNTPGGSRIRKRGTVQSGYKFYYTFKRDITPVKRIEIEKEITEQEYEDLLKKADPALKIIHKVRHCFEYKNQMFELDTYTFWTDRATVELELTNENDTADLPPYITLIKEVTNDLRYRNRSLAQRVITEDIL